MVNYTQEELEGALRAIRSALGKSEKVILKLKPGTSQYTMTEQGIAAYRMSIALISGASEGRFSKDELEMGVRALTSFIVRVEAVLPKFQPGTSQHTLAVRRIRAFEIGIALLDGELRKTGAAPQE